MRSLVCILLVLVLLKAQADSPFQLRGYYMTFMRMPVMGLPEWKQMIDCIHEDGGNTLLLWMGGAFRSKQFPITWQYNVEHKNVEHDFARGLIDYAHTKGIKVMLGFTPFGYDGVNQYPIEHPELKARKADDTPVETFGIHCWGWSLCPSRPEAQDFMTRYAREMAFEFYPNADGLLIESSDYNVCRCAECKDHFYEREFGFVRRISEEMWARKTNATIIVFPHYFTGKKVNQGSDIEAQAAKFPFDPRWTVVFSPHSAHIEPELLQKARSSIYWNDGPSLGTPWSIRDGVRTALKNEITGYVPSFEPMCYISPRQEFGITNFVGKRLKPLGLDWLSYGVVPLTQLPARVQRFAYRQFTATPQLPDEDFRKRVAAEFFGDPKQDPNDLLFLQETINRDRSWVCASPVVQPELARSPERRMKYRSRVERIREIAQRYEKSSGAIEKEMYHIASFIARRWEGVTFSDGKGKGPLPEK